METMLDTHLKAFDMDEIAKALAWARQGSIALVDERAGTYLYGPHQMLEAIGMAIDPRMYLMKMNGYSFMTVPRHYEVANRYLRSRCRNRASFKFEEHIFCRLKLLTRSSKAHILTLERDGFGVRCGVNAEIAYVLNEHSTRITDDNICQRCLYSETGFYTGPKE